MNPDPAPHDFRPPRVTNRGTRPPVYSDAAVIHGYPSSRLAAVEALWTPARAALAAERERAEQPLESAHWNWTTIYRRATHDLFAVEVNDAVQGLMAVNVRLRPSAPFPESWVVYVDYLEVAPWNLLAAGAGRFGRVGLLLLTAAVRVSLGRTGGRVGLHALPQAVDFYTHCGMTSFGEDPNYYDLAYFEYDEVTARDRLHRLETER